MQYIFYYCPGHRFVFFNDSRQTKHCSENTITYFDSLSKSTLLDNVLQIDWIRAKFYSCQNIYWGSTNVYLYSVGLWDDYPDLLKYLHT